MTIYIPQYGVIDDFKNLPDGTSSNEWEQKTIGEVEDGLFHIGQNYGAGIMPCKTFQCTQCGSKEFNVGQSNYFTAIRCIKCGWESCVHQG